MRIDRQLREAFVNQMTGGDTLTARRMYGDWFDFKPTHKLQLFTNSKPPAVYDEFERNVRGEYWWVPRARCAKARAGILQSFLERPSIYHWPRFRERYEAGARVNLERAIRALQPG